MGASQKVIARTEGETAVCVIRLSTLSSSAYFEHHYAQTI